MSTGTRSTLFLGSIAAILLAFSTGAEAQMSVNMTLDKYGVPENGAITVTAWTRLDGTPLPGAQVQLFCATGSFTSTGTYIRELTGITDSAGKFEMNWYARNPSPFPADFRIELTAIAQHPRHAEARNSLMVTINPTGSIPPPLDDRFIDVMDDMVKDKRAEPVQPMEIKPIVVDLGPDNFLPRNMVSLAHIAYAGIAVEQAALNRTQNLGFGGAAWNPDYRFHYDWAKGTSVPVLQGETVKRMKELAKKGMPPVGAVPTAVEYRVLHVNRHTDGEDEFDEPYVLIFPVVYDDTIGFQNRGGRVFGPYESNIASPKMTLGHGRHGDYIYHPGHYDMADRPEWLYLFIVVMENDDEDVGDVLRDSNNIFSQKNGTNLGGKHADPIGFMNALAASVDHLMSDKYDSDEQAGPTQWYKLDYADMLPDPLSTDMRRFRFNHDGDFEVELGFVSAL